jgi:hypothetical protein
VQAVGYGLLLPLTVAAVGLLLARRLGGGEPLGLGAGLAAGFVALAATKQTDWEFLQPKEPWDWLPALGLFAVVAAAVGQLVKWPRLVRSVGRTVVAFLAVAFLIRAQSARAPEPLGAYWAVALGAAVLVLWGVLDLAIRLRPGGTLPALLTLTAFAAAALCEMAGFLSLAQMAGVVAAALLGWALVAWRRPLPGVCRAGVAVLAVLLPAILFVAWFNKTSDLPSASFVLLLAAPLVLATLSLVLLGRASRLGSILLGAAALVPVTVALVLAARA